VEVVQKRIKQPQLLPILVVAVVAVHTTILLLVLELLAHHGKAMMAVRV
jgi:hypothetical protein